MTTSWYRLVVLFFGAVILTACGGSDSTNASSSGQQSSFAMALSSYGAPVSGIEGTGNCTPPCTSLSNAHLRMTTARSGHTATLLRNGQVLIAGGTDGLQALASAELYDPSTGTFTPTGDMTTARAGHTAVLLANGKVLIAGGSLADRSSYAAQLSAEIYDPAIGTFTATGRALASCCSLAQSTVLQDGRVFIATAGYAEIYDPSSGTFAEGTPYDNDIVYTVTLLGDGTVLVVGIAGPNANWTAGTTELYDPKTNTFSTAEMRACSDCVSTATLLMDGKVLFVEASSPVGEAEVFDPASRTFTHLGQTPVGAAFSTATRLNDGSVLIAGGMLDASAPTSSVQLPQRGSADVGRYVPATGTFVSAASLIIARYSHTATLLPDGTVLIAGGINTFPQPTASAQIYEYRP